MKVLVVRDVKSKRILAHAVRCKGSDEDGYAVQCLVDVTKRLGYSKVILTSDNKPAIVCRLADALEALRVDPGDQDLHLKLGKIRAVRKLLAEPRRADAHGLAIVVPVADRHDCHLAHDLASLLVLLLLPLCHMIYIKLEFQIITLFINESLLIHQACCYSIKYILYIN